MANEIRNVVLEILKEAPDDTVELTQLHQAVVSRLDRSITMTTFKQRLERYISQGLISVTKRVEVVTPEPIEKEVTFLQWSGSDTPTRYL